MYIHQEPQRAHDRPVGRSSYLVLGGTSITGRSSNSVYRRGGNHPTLANGSVPDPTQGSNPGRSMRRRSLVDQTRCRGVGVALSHTQWAVSYLTMQGMRGTTIIALRREPTTLTGRLYPPPGSTLIR